MAALNPVHIDDRMANDLMPIDDPIVDEIAPIWPNMATLDPADLKFRYDRASDTLYLHFYGKARSSFSHETSDGIYLLLDPESLDVVGIQVEDFLENAVKHHPRLVFALDVAELRGITYEEVRAMARKVVPLRERLAHALRDAIHRSTPLAKKERAFRNFKHDSGNSGGMLWAGC